MEYTKKTFSIPFMGKKYSENWEKIFGKKLKDNEKSEIDKKHEKK